MKLLIDHKTILYWRGPEQTFDNDIWHKIINELTNSLCLSTLTGGDAEAAELDDWPTTGGTTEPKTYPEPWNGFTDAWEKITNLSNILLCGSRNL